LASTNHIILDGHNGLQVGVCWLYGRASFSNSPAKYEEKSYVKMITRWSQCKSMGKCLSMIRRCV